MRLLDGNDVDSHDCLFIGPHLPGRDQFLTDRSQPVWEEQSTGKGRLIKAPDGAFSPDFFDAAGLGVWGVGADASVCLTFLGVLAPAHETAVGVNITDVGPDAGAVSGAGPPARSSAARVQPESRPGRSARINCT